MERQLVLKISVAAPIKGNWRWHQAVHIYENEFCAQGTTTS